MMKTRLHQIRKAVSGIFSDDNFARDTRRPALSSLPLVCRAITMRVAPLNGAQPDDADATDFTMLQMLLDVQAKLAEKMAGQLDGTQVRIPELLFANLTTDIEAIALQIQAEKERVVAARARAQQIKMEV